MTQHLYCRRVTVSPSAGLIRGQGSILSSRPSGCGQDQIQGRPCSYLGAPAPWTREKARLTFVHEGSQAKPGLAAVCPPARAAGSPSRDQRGHKSTEAGAPLSSAGAAQPRSSGALVPVLAGSAGPGIHSGPADGVAAPAPLLFPTKTGGPHGYTCFFTTSVTHRVVKGWAVVVRLFLSQQTSAAPLKSPVCLIIILPETSDVV